MPSFYPYREGSTEHVLENISNTCRGFLDSGFQRRDLYVHGSRGLWCGTLIGDLLQCFPTEDKTIKSGL